MQASTAPELEDGARVDVAAWGIALALGCRAIELFLEAQSLAGAVGQAILVEWGASRLGISWSAPSVPTTSGAVARRAGVGAAVGAGAAAVVFVTLLATQGVSLERVARVEASVLGVGLLTAALHAWRDELLLHGIALRALGGAVSPTLRVVACGVTSAGAALGRSDADARTVLVAALLGVVFGALWVRDRGAWQPWAAHTGLLWSLGTLLSGGVVHSRLADGAWAGERAGWLGGAAAVVALSPLAVMALVWAARISPRTSKRG